MVDADQLIDFNRFLTVGNDKLSLTFTDQKTTITIDKHQVALAQYLENPIQKVSFNAIYGIIPLVEKSYLMLVTKAKIIGQIMQRQVFQVDQMSFYAIGGETASKDKPYISALQSLFQTKTFYYSEEYDLSNSLQRVIENKALKNPTAQYMINQHYIGAFVKGQTDYLVPTFISGLVMIKYAKINGVDMEFALVSRRDSRRMGRRFVSRGADLDGNCSNYAETEQIVTLHSSETYLYSFLQTRGSMPFKWRQKPNLKYTPKGQVTADDSTNVEIIQRHFQDQSKLGITNQNLINLIDKKANQKMLGEYYQLMHSKLKNSNIKYIWFDFHAECKKMKYENLSKLINTIKDDLDQYDQFAIKYQKNKLQQIEVLKVQKGYMRTNCIDCLDRTNVVQSVIARHMLWKVLQQININKQGQSVFEKFPVIDDIFREIWTKNADVLSILYTGTGALKTDFTRTGKRTKAGALQDGKNSLVRYVLGNFYDGHNQDSIDLLTGKLQVQKKEHQFSQAAINPVFFMCLLVRPLFLGLGTYQVMQLPQVVSDRTETQVRLIGLTFFLLGFKVVQMMVLKMHKFFVKRPVLTH